MPDAADRLSVRSSRLWAIIHFNLTRIIFPARLIADHIGITYLTLRRRYREEIAHGRALAHLKVARTMFEMATESRDVSALKWWTATQMKWSPAPSQVELYTPAGQTLTIKAGREDSLAALFRSKAALALPALPRPGNGLEHDRPEGEEAPGDAGPRAS